MYLQAKSDAYAQFEEILGEGLGETPTIDGNQVELCEKAIGDVDSQSVAEISSEASVGTSKDADVIVLPGGSNMDAKVGVDIGTGTTKVLLKENVIIDRQPSEQRMDTLEQNIGEEGGTKSRNKIMKHIRKDHDTNDKEKRTEQDCVEKEEPTDRNTQLIIQPDDDYESEPELESMPKKGKAEKDKEDIEFLGCVRPGLSEAQQPVTLFDSTASDSGSVTSGILSLFILSTHLSPILL